VRNLTLAMMCLGAIAGCRASGGGNNNGPDAPNTGGDSGNTATSVKDIRMNQPTNGAAITLQNVVVTAHVSSSKYGHIYVQDQGGGQYSGIQLFCNYGGTHPDCSMTKAQIDAFAIGTVVNVTGTFSNFLSMTAPAGAQAILEIDAPVITATGGNMTPVAVDVDPTAIAHDQLTGGSDAYKGAYVHVTGTSFKATSIAATEFSMSCSDKSMPPQMGTTFSGFEAASGGQTLAIGLSFYNTLT